MPASVEDLLAIAQEWRATAELADAEGKANVARVCRAEAVACEKAAAKIR